MKTLSGMPFFFQVCCHWLDSLMALHILGVSVNVDYLVTELGKCFSDIKVLLAYNFLNLVQLHLSGSREWGFRFMYRLIRLGLG